MQGVSHKSVYEGEESIEPDENMTIIDNASANRNDVIKVFLISGNRLLREALSKVLGRRTDLRVLACVPYRPAVVSEVADLQPDVVVIESQLLDRGGRETVLAILKSQPAVRVLAFGMSSDESGFLSGVRAGIAGYLTQDASAAEISAAVRTVAHGGAVCPPSLCRALFDEIAGRSSGAIRPAATRRGVSRREQQILELVEAGLGNKEIATELQLSEQTVKNHMQRVFRRLGVGDRLEAVELCRDRGWIGVADRVSWAVDAGRGTTLLQR
jgi:DNA-binding NarL/FixJ family response regulator